MDSFPMKTLMKQVHNAKIHFARKNNAGSALRHGSGMRGIALAALMLLSTAASAAEHNPVIFLHGWNGNASGWDNMTNLLVSAGWQQKDLFPVDYWVSINTSLDDYSDYVCQAIQNQLNSSLKVDFVVHSMGGLVLRRLIQTKKIPLSKIGCVVDLASPHYGQFQSFGSTASEMFYGSSILWDMALYWDTTPPNVKWINIVGVDKVDVPGRPYWFGQIFNFSEEYLAEQAKMYGNRKAHHDGLVDQWSAVLKGTDTRYVNKCHASNIAEATDPPGETIYACGGDNSGQGCNGELNDPVFRIVKSYLESNGDVTKIPAQSQCGASGPSNEGGGIFIQVVDQDNKPISWTGNIVAKVFSKDGTEVPFDQYSGADHESRAKGICLLVYPVGTFRGFDPGVYDIEFNPTTNAPAFRWRGIRVEPNRPTVIRITPPTRPMLAICLDHSGSMSAADLAKAKASAKMIIDTVPAGTLVGIYAFADGVSTTARFSEVTDFNRSSLKASLDSFSSGGSTALWKAADTALNDMNELDPEHNNIGSIILLTDGGDNNSGSITRSSVVAKCQEMGVAFNSISYGDNAEASLKDVATSTGGRNVPATDSLSSLNDAFSRLLTYNSSKETISDTKGTVSTGTWTHRFVVDSSVTNLQATVTLSVPSSSATVYLVSPSGTKYVANSSTDVGSESCFVFLQRKPAAGTWAVSVTAPSGTQTSCYVDAAAFKEPPRLSLRVDDSDTTVFAHLSYGDPVDGANVRALFHENGATREVPFVSIGAGTYKLALADCGAFRDGFTVRADAVKGVATYTYVGVMDYEGDNEGGAIPESFTRSEWLDLRRLNDISVRYVSVHPRWPWEGKVDVDFTIVPPDSNTRVAAALVGIDAGSTDRFAISTVSCDDPLSDLGSGKHRLTWDVAKDVPNADIENFSIRFDVTTAKALANVSNVTASAGTYFDKVSVSWRAVSGATHYRVYRSESASETAARTLLATTTGTSYNDISAVAEKKYYYYWIQPICKKASGDMKYEGEMTVSGGGWKGSLGTISSLTASKGAHYNGVHLSWSEPTIMKNYPVYLGSGMEIGLAATALTGTDSSIQLATGSSITPTIQYNIYRSTSSSSSTKSLLATTTATYYVDTSTMASQSPKYYYYWVEPIAVISSVTYVGKLNTPAASGWRNKLGTPSFHFENWRPGHKSRPDIDLYIDGSVTGATRYEYMSGDQSWRWNAMEAVVNGTGSYDISSISSSASPKMSTIGWATAYWDGLRVYVRAANSEGAGDWVKWKLSDHLNESAFKNSEYYKYRNR